MKLNERVGMVVDIICDVKRAITLVESDLMRIIDESAKESMRAYIRFDGQKESEA